MAQPPKNRPNVEELVERWESDKKRSRLFLQIAEEYRKDDFVDAALTVLREGLKYQPHFAPARVALARCLMAKRQWTEAQSELEGVHEKSPDNLLAGKLLVEVLEERGEKARALAVAKELVPFAAFDDPEVEATAKRLEAELGGVEIAAGKEASDTMDFASGEDTGDLRKTDAETTADFATADADSTADFQKADAETTADFESADADSTADFQRADADTTADFESADAEDTASFSRSAPVAGAAPTLAEEETQLFGVEAFAEEEEAEPASLAAGVEDGPFGAAEAPAAPESPAEVTTPEAEPFGALPGPLPGSEAAVPDDLLGSPAEPGETGPAAQDDMTSVTLAELYEAQDSHEEAAEIYEKLLAKRPDDADLRAALERCRQRLAGALTEETAAAAESTGEVPTWEAEPPPAPAPVPQAPAEPEASPEQWKAVLAEYERWLSAARAVRQ